MCGEPMITSIQIQDFKGHRDSTVPLGRLTVLVGPNGSGKTSVLEALQVQSAVKAHPFKLFFRGDWALEDLQRRGAQGPIVLTSQGTSNDGGWRARLELTNSSTDLEWKHGEDARSFKLSHGQKVEEAAREILGRLGPAALYKLNAKTIAEAAYSDKPEPRIAADGTNTAVALAALKLGYDEVFARIEESLRTIIPNVDRVRIRQVPVERQTMVLNDPNAIVMGSKIFFDFAGARGVPAHAASEGTLITLALLTILHSPNRPKILLLDDFAESLHPQAQMELVRLIKRLLEELNDVQIVATTHSPYILDELDPSQVHAFALRDDGTVAVKSLSDHPQAAKMKGALTAGQLWSLGPEREWVLAGTAA